MCWFTFQELIPFPNQMCLRCSAHLCGLRERSRFLPFFHVGAESTIVSCVASLWNISLRSCSKLEQFVCCVAANNLHRSHLHDEQSREAKQQCLDGSKKFHDEGRVLEMFCRRARAWVRSWSMLQRKPEAEHLERRNDAVAKRSKEWKYKKVVSARG